MRMRMMTESLAMAAAAFATDIEKRESVGVAPRAELSAALCMAAAGAGVVMCEAGQVADEDVFVLDPVDVDDIVCPEMGFDHVPKSVERLGGDGVWRTVPFVVEPSGLVRLQTTVQPKTPAVFRHRE